MSILIKSIIKNVSIVRKTIIKNGPPCMKDVKIFSQWDIFITSENSPETVVTCIMYVYFIRVLNVDASRKMTQFCRALCHEIFFFFVAPVGDKRFPSVFSTVCLKENCLKLLFLSYLNCFNFQKKSGFFYKVVHF